MRYSNKQIIDSLRETVIYDVSPVCVRVSILIEEDVQRVNIKFFFESYEEREEESVYEILSEFDTQDWDFEILWDTQLTEVQLPELMENEYIVFER